MSKLLWLTEPAQNQIYKASIKLYMIVRSRDQDSKRAEISTKKVCTFLKSNLQIQRYEFFITEYEELHNKMKVELLQNNIVPQCLSYDQFPLDTSDLEEIIFIENTNQGLSVLSHGVYNRGIDNVSITVAEKILN